MSEITLDVDVVATVLEETHDAPCSFFACDGPDAPPVDMATCTHHWAYHHLREAVGDRIHYVRDGFDPISIDAYHGLISTKRPDWTPGLIATHITERLEYLRGELRAQCISQGELIELASLSEHIEPGDVELLEAAGVPEFPDEGEASS